MFYDKLVALCRDRGESVTGACNNAGIASTQVSRWKTNGTFPTNNALRKLCDYFKVPLTYFDEDHPSVDDVPVYTDDKTEPLTFVVSLLKDLIEYPEVLDLLYRLKQHEYTDVDALIAMLEALHR